MNINGENSELLSLDEIAELHNRYETLRNPISNTIGLDELKIIIKELGYIATIEEIQDIAGETAQKIDFIYLLVIIGRIKREMNTPQYKMELTEAFDHLDIDKNGTIELSELLCSHTASECGNSHLNQTEMRQIFNSIDKDHDQHITREEYLEFLNEKNKK